MTRFRNLSPSTKRTTPTLVCSACWLSFPYSISPIDTPRQSSIDRPIAKLHPTKMYSTVADLRRQNTQYFFPWLYARQCLRWWDFFYFAFDESHWFLGTAHLLTVFISYYHDNVVTLKSNHSWFFSPGGDRFKWVLVMFANDERKMYLGRE
jgi:hypothetical protein